MNIFSNLGITELLIILILALLVVGPERLPELAQKLAKMLRDARKAYDNLTADLGPELTALQETTKDLRESVQSVRSIPQDMVQTVVRSADLDETVKELKQVQKDVGQIGQTLSEAGKVVKDPLGAATDAARQAMEPKDPTSAGTDGGEAVTKPVTGQPEAETEGIAVE